MMTLTKGWSIKAVPYYARKQQAWEDKIDQMGLPAVTVIVVPRERFSSVPRSLECVYRDTNVPFNLVYVDGGSPEKTKRYLEAEFLSDFEHLDLCLAAGEAGGRSISSPKPW